MDNIVSFGDAVLTNIWESVVKKLDSLTRFATIIDGNVFVEETIPFLHRAWR